MTKIRLAETSITEGEHTVSGPTEYFEVGVHEVDNMLKKVSEGGNETKLREELIRSSEW